jgi:thymidine kinase
MSGRIELVVGPMFSGKSTELMRRVRRAQLAGQQVVVLKYAGDTRYTDAAALQTHDAATLAARPVTHLMPLLSEMDDVLAEAQMVAIDEGQFLPDLAEFAERMANAGRTVVIAALDSDFQRRAFPVTAAVMPLAERIDKLSAVCLTCGGDAAFSRRLVADTEVELIGGAESYAAACRTCHK